MRINKDFVDSVMMLSFILLVLIGTTEFSDGTEKNIFMGILGGISVLMVFFRILYARQPKDKGDEGFQY